MPLKVIHHPEARRELEEAGRYYNEQSPGLADEFFDEVDAFISKIIANPQRYAIRTGDARRVNLKRFPYHLNYILHGGHRHGGGVPSPAASVLLAGADA